jgi:hypothetical protein
MERRSFLLGLGALLVTPTRAFAAGPTLAVVCNPASGIASLTRAQIDAIFRAKTQQFPGGGRVTPVNLPAENPSRREFDRAVLGLEPDEVERFWIDSKIRSGTGAPRSLSGPSAVARYVATEKTGVGYLPPSEVDPTLRVVAVVRNGTVIAS